MADLPVFLSLSIWISQDHVGGHAEIRVIANHIADTSERLSKAVIMPAMDPEAKSLDDLIKDALTELVEGL